MEKIKIMFLIYLFLLFFIEIFDVFCLRYYNENLTDIDLFMDNYIW